MKTLVAADVSWRAGDYEFHPDATHEKRRASCLRGMAADAEGPVAEQRHRGISMRR